jgi:mannose-6-phosphate isomerase-like protein (cupin superfamily)
MEVHQIVDQFLRIEQGEGTVVIDSIERKINLKKAVA